MDSLLESRFELMKSALDFPGLWHLFCWLPNCWYTQNAAGDDTRLLLYGLPMWRTQEHKLQHRKLHQKSGLCAVTALEVRFVARIQIPKDCLCSKEPAGVVPDPPPACTPVPFRDVWDASSHPAAPPAYPSWVWAALLLHSGLKYQLMISVLH